MINSHYESIEKKIHAVVAFEQITSEPPIQVCLEQFLREAQDLKRASEKLAGIIEGVGREKARKY